MGKYNIEEEIIICSSGLQTVFYRVFDENHKQILITSNPLLIDTEMKRMEKAELYKNKILPDRRQHARILGGSLNISEIIMVNVLEKVR
jgi:hypothetical protein